MKRKGPLRFLEKNIKDKGAELQEQGPTE
jgi:hypothetical protein